MRLAGFGLAADLPPGWDGRAYRRPPDRADTTTRPVLHAANFPLPADRGDFGSGAVETMGPDDVFVAFVEYAADSAGSALFAGHRPAPIRPEHFRPDQLQRALPGQGGAQFFFTERGRAFCLYVVLGSYHRRARLVSQVEPVVRELVVT
jgi:hypothetical protein